MYEDRSLWLYASVASDWKIKCVHSSQLFLFHQKKPIVGDTPTALAVVSVYFARSSRTFPQYVTHAHWTIWWEAPWPHGQCAGLRI